MNNRKYEIIGGFVVRELSPIRKSQDNEIAKCFTCGHYGTRGEMGADSNGKYICKKCDK